MDRRDAAVLAALLIVFVASRALWLSQAMPSSIYWEETYRWVAINELLHRPFHSLLTYQADPYQGGSLLMILLATALMKVFGATAFVMKMTAVLYSGATLSLLYVLARKAFDRMTAIVAGVAYVAGPPIVAYWGLTLMGSHSESVLPSLATILLFLRLLCSQTRTRATWAALGLTAGLGLWFCYTTGLTLFSCVLVWLALRGFPRARELGAAVAGGLAGMVPWVVYNVAEGFTGLSRLWEMFGYGHPLDLWVPQALGQKLWFVLTRDIPAGATLLFDAPALSARAVGVLQLAFAAPFFLGVAVSLLRVAMLAAPADPAARPARVERDATLRARESFFTVYLLVFLAFLCASRFTSSGAAPVDFRLYLPPLVIALIPLAVTVARALRSAAASAPALPLVARLGAQPVAWPPRAIAAGGLAVVHLAASAVATVAFAVGHADTRTWVENITGYQMQGVLLHVKYRPDHLDRADAVAREVEDRVARFRVFLGLGWGLALDYRATGDLDPIRAYVDRHPDEEKMALLQGMRWVADTMSKSLDTGADPACAVPSLRKQARERMAALFEYAEQESAALPRNLRFIGLGSTTLPGRFIDLRDRK